MGITTEFVGFIPTSLVLRSIVLPGILMCRNWAIQHITEIKKNYCFSCAYIASVMLISQVRTGMKQALSHKVYLYFVDNVI